MKVRTSSASVLTVVAIGLMLMQCGCGAEEAVTTGFLSDYSRLETKSESSLRYVDETALAQYSNFIVDRVEVHFHEGAHAIEQKSEGKLTEQDLADLTNYFHSAIVEAIDDAGFRVVYQPGPGVARLRVAVTDMEETNVILAAIPQARLATGAGVGDASLEAEMLDSQTGRQIGAIVETRAGSRVPFTGLSEWGGAKDAMDQWAKQLRKRLEEAHGK